mgnify:CR=1 FL=1
MKLEYILMAVTFAGLFLAAAIFQKSKERKGRGGADLARLRDIAAKQLDDSGCYTIAYACCSQVRLSVGRPVTTTYYSYIAAFRPGTLFVIPLQFSGREMVSHPGFRLDRENVGAVRTDRAGRVTFYAADGTELCTLCVSAGNTADGPFQPLGGGGEIPVRPPAVYRPASGRGVPAGRRSPNAPATALPTAGDGAAAFFLTARPARPHKALTATINGPSEAKRF